VDLTTAVTIVSRRLWIVALCGLAALGTAAFVNTRIVPEYKAVTLLAVNQISPEGNLTNYDTLLANETLAKSYAETIKSRAILTEVISRLNLDTTAGQFHERVTATLVPETQLLRL
jgi:capsular polysaccharide biosynthesis protein